MLIIVTNLHQTLPNLGVRNVLSVLKSVMTDDIDSFAN